MRFRSIVPMPFTKVILSAALALAISGCVTGSTPTVYPETAAAGTTKLTPVRVKKVRMGLAPGWKQISKGVDGKTTVLAFQHKASGGEGRVLCLDTVLDSDQTAFAMQSGVKVSSPKARRVRGPFTIGSGPDAPTFEVYNGTVMVNGRKVPLTYYIGYNLVRENVCSYGLLVVTGESDERADETAFVGMLRSVR